MDQKIGYAEHGIAFVVAHVHLDHGAVGLDHHAVQCKWQRDPLIRLDAAVVVRVQKREAVGLCKRILLEVKARRVDVRAENVQALRERLLPDVREHERLAMGERPHLVACRECAPIADRLVERAVAALLGLRDDRCGACALRLVV